VYNFKLVEKVTPSTIKQYSYCPVIPWIQTWFKIQEPYTDSMLLGREAYTQLKGRGQVYVSTRKGATVLDEVVKEKKYCVIVERKAFKSHNYSRYVEQAATSYLIAREKMQRVRKLRLEVQGVAKEIELTEDLIHDVEGIVESASKTLASEKPPHTRPDPRKCSSCWYKRFCPLH